MRDDPMSRAVVAAPGATGDRLAVLYDGDCGLCTWVAGRLRRWDRQDRLSFIRLQDVDRLAPPDVARLVRGRRLETELHVVDPATGLVASGGAGVLEIASRLPGGQLARLARSAAPARWATDIGYRIVARNRHRIGRWLRLEGPVCDVPQ
jgi:predicted DCC family thiol-disulfide oxidoreductase YuxK